MQIEKHPIWDAPDVKTFKEQWLGELYLKPEVSEEIREQAFIINKLLLHSYYEYDFIDIAMLQGIISFEKALRIRYSELENKSARKLNLGELIDWALTLKLFEDPNPDIYKVYREIRNKKVHDVQNSVGGLFYIRAVQRIFDFINDLYEDTVLRIQRWDIKALLYKEFETEFNNGFLFDEKGKKWIGYKVIPVFLNNKIKEPTLTLSVSKIYDPNYFSATNGIPGNVSVIKVSNWRLSDYGFIAQTEAGEFKIETIKDDINQGKYAEWTNHPYILNRRMVISFAAYDKHGYEASLREFHKQPTANMDL